MSRSRNGWQRRIRAGGLAAGLKRPAGGAPPAEAAQALDALVRCPNENESDARVCRR